VYHDLLNFYRKGEITLCPSHFSELAITKYGKLRTRVVSNGVDLKKFHKINTNFLYKKYNLNKKDKRILFVGRLDPEKNVITLIKSIKYLVEKYPNIHIDIVGGQTDVDNLTGIVQDKKYKDKITCYGRVDEKDLIGFYNACDIYVQPSIFELEGMVVLEAIACGKPIIISNSKESAAKHFVEGNGFLFKTKDPKDLAEKILHILKNPKLKAKFGKKSRELAKKYDINKSVDMLEQTYDEILKEEPKKLRKEDEKWLVKTLPMKIYHFLAYASKNSLINLKKVNIYGIKLSRLKIPKMLNISRIKLPKVKIPQVKIPNTGLSKTVFRKW
jgi:glycosyltransferase involved in cell wall biosynthesis